MTRAAAEANDPATSANDPDARRPRRRGNFTPGVCICRPRSSWSAGGYGTPGTASWKSIPRPASRHSPMPPAFPQINPGRIAERRHLLTEAGIVLPGDLSPAGERAAIDDVLDAALATWTAVRVIQDQALPHPDPQKCSAEHWPAQSGPKPPSCINTRPAAFARRRLPGLARSEAQTVRFDVASASHLGDQVTGKQGGYRAKRQALYVTVGGRARGPYTSPSRLPGSGRSQQEPASCRWICQWETRAGSCSGRPWPTGPAAARPGRWCRWSCRRPRPGRTGPDCCCAVIATGSRGRLWRRRAIVRVLPWIPDSSAAWIRRERHGSPAQIS
jgi:hypothetical protein